MDLIGIHLQNTLQTIDGITAFAVLQSLAFTYWSQSNDFKDNVKYGGHWIALGMIVIFAVLYTAALCIAAGEEIELLARVKTSDSGFSQTGAVTSHNDRVGVVVVFSLISALFLARYFLGRYGEQWKTLPADRGDDQS